APTPFCRIFVILILFPAFPLFCSALSIALYLPFHFVLLGIVLRGAAFVFRAYSHRAGARVTPAERGWGVGFGAASSITRLLLGTCLGAVSGGRIRVTAGSVAVAGSPWAAPVAL